MDTNVNIGNELKENYTEERNKLINVYKAQAEKIALKYSGLGIDDEDLVQSAYEGLIRGVDKVLSRSFKNRFKEVINEIHKSVCTIVESVIGELKSSEVGYGHYISKKTVVMVLFAYNDLTSELGREPLLIEMCERLNYSKDLIETILKFKDRVYLTYFDDVTDDSLDLQHAFLSDQEEYVICRDEFSRLLCVENLSDRQRQYLEYLDMEYTGKEIANLMKVSYSRSEQIKHDIRFRLNLVQDVSTLLADFGTNYESLEYEKSFLMRRKRDRQNNRDR